MPASSCATTTPSLPLAVLGLTTTGNPQAGHSRGRGTSRSSKRRREASLDALTRYASRSNSRGTSHAGTRSASHASVGASSQAGRTASHEVTRLFAASSSAVMSAST